MLVLFGSITEYCMVDMAYGLGSSPRLAHGGSNKGPINLDFSALSRGTSQKSYQNHGTGAITMLI
jgi:hypothetical protein